MTVSRSTSGERMASDITAAAHYDTLALWGQPPDPANAERLARTQALVPIGTRSVLDVGCGDGTSSAALLDRVPVVVDLDLSPRALRFVAGVPVAGSITALPFPDRSFDVVLAAEVIEHLPTDVMARALAEMGRVAENWVIVSTPNGEQLAARQAECARCGRRFHPNWHQRRFTAARHRRLAPAGFKWRRTDGVGTWRQSWVLAAGRRAVGHLVQGDGLTCPHCGHGHVVRPAYNLGQRAGLRLLAMAGPLVRPRARWIVSAYARRGSA